MVRIRGPARTTRCGITCCQSASASTSERGRNSPYSVHYLEKLAHPTQLEPVPRTSRQGPVAGHHQYEFSARPAGHLRHRSSRGGHWGRIGGPG